ncbi:replication protein RepA [Methylophaga frappieri]|nr:replication protein RepA [Methylophaga frappieri]
MTSQTEALSAEEKNVHRFITQASDINSISAQEAGSRAYMPRSLVLATLPHSKRQDPFFVRKNGNFSLALMAHPDIGLPYGSLPRLLIAFLTTEAVRTNSRDIELGKSLSDFLTKLKETPNGGPGGGITRVKEQMRRLFSTRISCTYTNKNLVSGTNLDIVDSYDLWWHPTSPDQSSLFKSHVCLNEGFFKEVTQRPVPIDMRALMALKKSPLEVDIYCWLTYRMSYLERTIVISWQDLQIQIGSSYARMRDFKAKFIQHLNRVLAVYPSARVRAVKNGLELKPSLTHIPKR